MRSPAGRVGTVIAEPPPLNDHGESCTNLAGKAGTCYN